MLYPEVNRIRDVSVIVARCVIREAQSQHVDAEKALRNMGDRELEAWIKSKMYDPKTYGQEGGERRKFKESL